MIVVETLIGRCSISEPEQPLLLCVAEALNGEAIKAVAIVVTTVLPLVATARRWAGSTSNG